MGRRRQRELAGQFQGTGELVTRDGTRAMQVTYDLILMQENVPSGEGDESERRVDGAGSMTLDVPPSVTMFNTREFTLRIDDGRGIDVVVRWTMMSRTHQFTASSGFKA